MPIPSVPLSCCCDWGTGWIGSSPSVTPLVVVGHQRIVNSNTDTVNLSALDLEGNLQWQVLMGNDSFGFNKKPIHVRFGADGSVYVAWNSPGNSTVSTSSNKYTFGTAASPFGAAATVGGVDKYDRNGNLIWSCELPAQHSLSGGPDLHAHQGNCLDVSPFDGTIWTSTYRDVNDNFIHQINQSSGAVIQSFGEAEFTGSAISLPYGIGAAGTSVAPWIRVTESGNIWFSLSGSSNSPARGPFKCDSSGEILETYAGTFGPDGSREIFPCYSILVMDEDDIVFCGGVSGYTGSSAPTDHHVIERWDVSANSKTWGRSPFDHPVSYRVFAGHTTNASYRGYWVDGDQAKFIYSLVAIVQDQSFHDYTLFHLDGAGDSAFASTRGDQQTPFTDPRDHVGNNAAVACLPDHIFVAGNKVFADGTQGLVDAMVVRINTNDGRKDWVSDLDRASGGTFSFCIAAHEG